MRSAAQRSLLALTLFWTAYFPTAEAQTNRPTRVSDPVREAELCLVNGDYACVIRLLGGGRARGARALSLLAQAQRQSTGPSSSCATVSELLERFPESVEADRWRQFHRSTCP